MTRKVTLLADEEAGKLAAEVAEFNAAHHDHRVWCSENQDNKRTSELGFDEI